jgi:hypothetical protein
LGIKLNLCPYKKVFRYAAIASRNLELYPATRMLV